MSKDSIIEFKNVSKKIGQKEILSDISFEVNKGEVIGIIGSNGSGKTTLLRLASGLSYSTDGEIKINNEILKQNKKICTPYNIGILIENPIFIQNMTGFKNLYYLSKIINEIDKEEVSNSMKKVGLDPNSKQLVSQYSLGMRQRLGIAQAIMENPDLLLLDEPTNGLDEQGISLFGSIIEEFKNKFNLNLKKDYMYFIDSTMFRLSLKNKLIISEVRTFFKNKLKGYYEENLENYFNKFDSKYGDIKILLKPGNVFYPDYFNYKKNKGMHGYNSKTQGQEGTFVSISSQKLIQEKFKEKYLYQINEYIIKELIK